MGAIGMIKLFMGSRRRIAYLSNSFRRVVAHYIRTIIYTVQSVARFRENEIHFSLKGTHIFCAQGMETGRTEKKRPIKMSEPIFSVDRSLSFTFFPDTFLCENILLQPFFLLFFSPPPRRSKRYRTVLLFSLSLPIQGLIYILLLTLCV